jgi:hypothetical protein
MRAMGMKSVMMMRLGEVHVKKWGEHSSIDSREPEAESRVREQRAERTKHRAENRE